MLILYRFVVVGDNSSRGYISKFYAESIGFHSDFASNTVALTALSSGQETITSVSASISSPTSQTASAWTCSIMSLTYNLNPSNEYISDVYFQVSVQSLSMNENTILNITPDLSCSVSGSTSLSFSIASYNGETIPSFVSIDVTSGLLSISSLEVTADTVYHFYVNTLNSTATFPAHKLIELTVKNVVVTTSTSATPSSTPPQQSCLVSNCKSCISTSNYIWSEWNSGYGLQSGSWYVLCCSSTTTSWPSKHISNWTTTSASVIAGTTTNSVVGATAWIAVGSSLMNAASFSSLWSMVNQLQLFFLLLITNIYLPDGVTATITQSNFFVFPFSFFKIKHIGSIDIGIDNFDIELNNANIEYFGINSESTLFNIYPLWASLILIFILHFTVYWILKYLLICKTDGRWSKLITIMKYIFNRMYFMLTYGYYIRTLMETYQYILVSSLNEIYYYDITIINEYRIVILI